MALIECEECGKKISDKASTCVNCGCPIKLEQKENEGKENNSNSKNNISKKEYTIEEAVIDCKRINKTQKILVITTISSIIAIFLFLLPLCKRTIDAYTIAGTYYPERVVYDFQPLLIVAVFLIFPIIVIILVYISLNYYMKNKLTLTNKRIIGSIYRIGAEEHIDIPIEKINVITSTKTFGNINGISISSAFYKTYHLSYIENAEEFRKKALELIDNKND